MLNEQTIRLYDEIRAGARMGVCLTEDMLKRYEDDLFRYELIRLQNEYKYIESEADNAIREHLDNKNDDICIAGKRMATSMEVSVIESVTANEVPEIRKNPYPCADEQSKKLAESLVKLEKEHRNMYKRFLN